MRRVGFAARAARHAYRALLVATVVALASACGGSTSSPTGVASPSGARSAGPSRAPASARPSPSPNPSTAAIAAFVALVTKDGFSYQATFTGRSRHTTDILPISKGVLQVHGKDVLVRATFKFPTGSSTVEHRWVGGKGWIRYDTSLPWERLALKAEGTMAAFAWVRTPADVTFVEAVTSGGKTLFKVSFRSAIVNPVMIPASNLTETALKSPKLTLLIDAAGRPVRGTAEIDGQGRVSGQLQEIVIDLEIAFTKLGQAVSIKAP